MRPLSCFTCTELVKDGLVSRLLGRKLRANCFIEIQNLLATIAVSQLSAANIEHLLSEYALPRTDAAPKLIELYAAAVRHLAADGELSEQEQGELKQLRYVLGLTDGEATTAHEVALRDIYREHLLVALADGHLSDDETATLAATTRSFGLPDTVTAQVYKEEVVRVVQKALDAAIADRRYTPEEEKRLSEMAANLGVNITHTEQDRQQLERFRRLARIEGGHLPVVDGPRLQKGERCHAAHPCRLAENRTVTKQINYSGPSGSIRIMKGVSYRYGSRTFTRVTAQEMRDIDTGTLYVTSKRLVFDGHAKNQSISYKKVIGFTVYSDGVQIQKDTGRDQYFLGGGDTEMLGAILDVAISRSHAGD